MYATSVEPPCNLPYFSFTIPRNLHIFFLLNFSVFTYVTIRANTISAFVPKTILELADLDYTNPAPPHLAGVTIFFAAVDPFVVYPIPASVSQCVDQISPASIAPFEMQEQTKQKCGWRVQSADDDV